ncbi:hypothetical protein XENTR_v10015415 [Xenopus tropicalis]|nr:hypothetical protein XENTR_v10015415 [Xenopus tropicalis]
MYQPSCTAPPCQGSARPTLPSLSPPCGLYETQQPPPASGSLGPTSLCLGSDPHCLLSVCLSLSLVSVLQLPFLSL